MDGTGYLIKLNKLGTERQHILPSICKIKTDSLIEVENRMVVIRD
jgi:hypothetical protein